jgi:hypothetical protein
MPARSNDFQRLVFLIKKVLAGTAATVTESKFLTDLQTGDKREVDVCIETEVAGHPVVVCLECRDHQRLTSVEWVEQMIGKHRRLPTKALVLVSRSGFSKRARSVAKVSGVETMSYTSINEQEIEKTIDLTRSVWAMTYHVDVTKVVGVVPAVDALPGERVVLMQENYCYNSAGRLLGTINNMVSQVMQHEQLAETFRRDGTEAHTFLTAKLTKPTCMTGERVFIEKLEPRILRPLDELHITGKCRVRRARFDLTHGSLGPVRVAWGSSVLDGRRAMLVAMKREGAEPTVTLHLPELAEEKTD